MRGSWPCARLYATIAGLVAGQLHDASGTSTSTLASDSESEVHALLEQQTPVPHFTPPGEILEGLANAVAVPRISLQVNRVGRWSRVQTTAVTTCGSCRRSKRKPDTETQVNDTPHAISKSRMGLQQKQKVETTHEKRALGIGCRARPTCLVHASAGRRPCVRPREVQAVGRSAA
eukprot:scaffold106115_cov66-Phaeocystis_antarctica.AAC.4